MLKPCSPVKAGCCILATTFWPDFLLEKFKGKGKGIRQGEHWGFGSAAKNVSAFVGFIVFLLK